MQERVRITVREDTDVLVRILVMLRRRGCQIVAVDYTMGDRHRQGWVRLAYAPPAARAHVVRGWLRNLVDVLAVEDD